MGGTGLGLSIVKHLIQSIGGEIAVDSRRRRGDPVHRQAAPILAPPLEIPSAKSPGGPSQKHHEVLVDSLRFLRRRVGPDRGRRPGPLGPCPRFEATLHARGRGDEPVAPRPIETAIPPGCSPWLPLPHPTTRLRRAHRRLPRRKSPARGGPVRLSAARHRARQDGRRRRLEHRLPDQHREPRRGSRRSTPNVRRRRQLGDRRRVHQVPPRRGRHRRRLEGRQARGGGQGQVAGARLAPVPRRLRRDHRRGEPQERLRQGAERRPAQEALGAGQRKVKTWKDLDPSWPDREDFKFYCPDDKDSGTFDFFTEAVVGKAKSQRSDVQASSDDNTLVKGVAGDDDGIGYFGYAYYKASTPKHAPGHPDQEGQADALAIMRRARRRSSTSPMQPPVAPSVSFTSRRSRPSDAPPWPAFVTYYHRERAKALAEKARSTSRRRPRTTQGQRGRGQARLLNPDPHG